MEINDSNSEYLEVNSFDTLLDSITTTSSTMEIGSGIFTRANNAEGTNTLVELNRILQKTYSVSNTFKTHVGGDIVPLLQDIKNSYIKLNKSATDSLVAKNQSERSVKGSGKKKSNASGSKTMYDYLKEWYGFTDDEMEYLKENYSELLKELYIVRRFSSYDANLIYKQLREKLDEVGYGYLNEANALVEQYNLNDEQKLYISNLDNMIGYSYTYSYTKGGETYTVTKHVGAERVASMKVAAAALFEFGKSEEFVAAVLGNTVFEGGAGHIEDTNYTDYKNEPYYIKNVEDWFELQMRGPVNVDIMAKGSYFDINYADEFIFELEDSKTFIKTLGDYIVDSDAHDEKIIGIGMCQWTQEDRLDDLLGLYANGKYSYTDIVQAEASMIVKELSGEFKNGVEGVDDHCENKFGGLSGKEEVRQDAIYFYNNYEIGAEDNEENRADVACDIYDAMNGAQ